MELSPKQQEIAVLLGAGLSNKEIAEQLGMATRTVKQHLTRIAMKKGLSGVHRISIARMYMGNARPLPAMTPKARAIACWAIEGLPNKEIAAREGTTEQTVKNYLRTVYDITGTWSRLELATRYGASSIEGGL
jgi:DNA-binding CsgD family transcriptional regulator